MPTGDLSDFYLHPQVIAERREGIWHSATLRDGGRVRVLVLSQELRAMVRSAVDFFATLERISAIHHPVLNVPRTWGELSTGALHVAFEDAGQETAQTTGLSASQVSALGARCARGLAVAHEMGLADGSLSPERVAPGGGDGIQIRGFGLLAALITGGAAPREAALLLAEPSYLSPEVQNDGVPDEHSDVYSLGAILYELLTGKPPYGGRTTAYVLASVLAEDAESTASVPETTNPAVDALVRAIERSPEDRWPSMSAFADALEAGVVVSAPQSAAVTGKKGCLFPAAAVVTVVVALGALGRWLS